MLKALKIKLEGARLIAVLGVGSELRGDDAAGLMVAEKLQNRPGLGVILGGTAPENFTGEIKKLQPSHLIIVDAAEFGEKPGAVRQIDLNETGGGSFSTHSLPMKILVDYLAGYFTFKAILIGIQPKSLAYSAPVSEEVKAAVEEVASTILLSYNAKIS
ncbi:MAG: hydrogenase maturation peptidase HycI [Candidatus Margulisiibacteriota bacterium]